MPARVRVKRVDRGWKKARRLIKQPRVLISVGVQGREGNAKSGDEDGAPSVADVAAINELGLGVPERSFLRSTIDAGRGKYAKLLRGIGQAAIEGKINLRAGAGIIGEVVVGDVKQSISNGIPPPNAESTIVAKGSSTPLIDSGQMRGSITSKVTKSKLTGNRT